MSSEPTEPNSGPSVSSRQASAAWRSRAEDSDQRLRFALDAAGIGEWSLDLRTNEAHRSLLHDNCFGYTELLPHWSYETFLAHIVPEDRVHVDACFQAAMAGQGEYDDEFRAIWPDGSVHWLWTRGRFYFDGEPTPVRVAGIVVDISERKRNQRQMARALERLTEAQRIGRIGDWEWDRVTNRIDWSPQVFELMGRDPSLGAPKDIAALEAHFDAGSVERQRAGMEAAFSTRTAQEYELTVLPLTGPSRELHAVAVPIMNEAGEVTGLYGTVQDITERKKLELRVLQAQRMESIGTLAGGIAHDLNNVLAPIVLSLELLRESFPDSASLALIESIERSAAHGAEMVKQVLNFARGMGGERLAVEVSPLLVDIAKIARDTFLKHIEIASRVPDDLWTVVGDQTQSHQVILNLCVNARDAMPSGGTLTLTAENIVLDEQYAGLAPNVDAGPYVRIRVVDTGIGMSPSTIAQIFDPFFTTKEVGRGTGLGLSTSEAIIKSHGGFIRVYSELGHGSTFAVYLPARAEPAATERKAPPTLPRGRGELVLVVDDEPSVRHITQQTLEAFGYRAITASDGAEALAAYTLRRGEISVVITDMMMPTMDGASVIRVLRRLDPELRIIAASGLDVKAQVAGLGVEHTLTKPYAAEALLTLLREVLE